MRWSRPRPVRTVNSTAPATWTAGDSDWAWAGLAVPALPLLLRRTAPPGLALIVAGGVLYTSARSATTAVGVRLLRCGSVLPTPQHQVGLAHDCGKPGVELPPLRSGRMSGAALKQRIAVHGLRNWLLVAIAPIATIASVVDHTVRLG